MSFALSLAAATVAGLGLAAAIWVGGTGWLALVHGGRAVNGVCAYPLGLLGVTLVAFAWLLQPLLGIVATVAYLAPAARGPSGVGALARSVARPVLCVLPLAVAFGAVLGLYDRGPSATHDSHVFGDVIWWIARGISAERSPLHLPDLTAAGYSMPAPEVAPALIGGFMRGDLHLDPFLVFATALPVCMIASLAVGLRLLAVGHGGRSPEALAALGLLLVGGSIYPTWLAESPPVALAVPLALAVVALARERVAFPAFLLLIGVIGVDVLATKIVATTSLAPILLWALVHYQWERVRGNAVLLALGALAAFVVGVLVLVATAAWTLHTGLTLGFDPVHVPGALADFARQRTLASLTVPLVVAAELLVLAQALRARAAGALVGLVCGVGAAWIVHGQNFAIGARLALVVAALALVLDREPDVLGTWLLLAAGACIALAAAVSDTAELPTSAPLAALLAGALCVAAGAALGAGARTLLLPAALAAAVAAVAVAGHGDAALALGMLAVGALVLRPPRRLAVAGVAVVALGAGATLALAAGRHQARLGAYDTTILPHDAFDLWRHVRATTPPDALVFVTQTGDAITPTTGWNYYPAAGERQVFLAGWVYSELGVKRDTRERLLTENWELFRGLLAPASIPAARSHSAFYAVMWKNQAHPRSFRAVYDNRLFVLYRVPPRTHSPVLMTSYDCLTYTTCKRLPTPQVSRQ